MNLYLLRHAEAEPLAASDAARRLTAKGERQADDMGRFCSRHKIHPEIILTSPLTRAEQTARIVGERLGREVVVAPFLASGMTAQSALEELAAYQRFRDLMIVGHQPDFGELVSVLIGLNSPASLHLRKGSLTGLSVEQFLPEGASLEFLLPVRLS